MKTKRSKATDIPQRVKEEVWERDKMRCIFCGSMVAMPNAHVIPRSHGGLGVAKNIVTACMGCHYAMDNTVQRPVFLAEAKEYLRGLYPDWNEKELIYSKWE